MVHVDGRHLVALVLVGLIGIVAVFLAGCITTNDSGSGVPENASVNRSETVEKSVVIELSKGRDGLRSDGHEYGFLTLWSLKEYMEKLIDEPIRPKNITDATEASSWFGALVQENRSGIAVVRLGELRVAKIQLRDINSLEHIDRVYLENGTVYTNLSLNSSQIHYKLKVREREAATGRAVDIDDLPAPAQDLVRRAIRNNGTAYHAVEHPAPFTAYSEADVLRRYEQRHFATNLTRIVDQGRDVWSDDGEWTPNHTTKPRYVRLDGSIYAVRGETVDVATVEWRRFQNSDVFADELNATPERVMPYEELPRYDRTTFDEMLQGRIIQYWTCEEEETCLLDFPPGERGIRHNGEIYVTPEPGHGDAIYRLSLARIWVSADRVPLEKFLRQRGVVPLSDLSQPTQRFLSSTVNETKFQRLIVTGQAAYELQDVLAGNHTFYVNETFYRANVTAIENATVGNSGPTAAP